MNKKIATLGVALSGAMLAAACGGNDGTPAAPATTANTTCVGTEATPERLFLQQLTDSSVIIKWRGDAKVACLGTTQSNLQMRIEATTTAGDHKEVKVTGLTADTTYHYSVGGAAAAPAEQSFKTAPLAAYPSDDGNIRIWVVGDSGTAGYLGVGSEADKAKYSGVADAVRQGMNTFTGTDGQKIDMFLMLGDNAYDNGDDKNYQAAVFDTYRSELKRVALWSTIGNHEMGTVDISAFIGRPPGTRYSGGASASSDPNKYFPTKEAITANAPSLMPYLDIFSPPVAGEAGGIASATKQYYSFKYGKVHVISLDSQLTARDVTQRNTMKDWLVRDLQAASMSSDWIVVIFHHPPYSKGANHDSDHDGLSIALVDQPQVDMRNEFVPVFQQFGVDLVLNGHSHSYERSFYLKDLYAGTTGVTYGDSDEFKVATNSYGPGYSGRTIAGEEYIEKDGYVVYTVTGNGGKADPDYGQMKTPTEWLNHLAHVLQPYWDYVGTQIAGTSKSKVDHKNGLAIPGSVLIDANKSRLNVRMLNAGGESLDQFVIKKK